MSPCTDTVFEWIRISSRQHKIAERRSSGNIDANMECKYQTAFFDPFNLCMGENIPSGVINDCENIEDWCNGSLSSNSRS